MEDGMKSRMLMLLVMVLASLSFLPSASGSGGTKDLLQTSYTIGGTVKGLSGTLVLENNGESLTVTQNGSFTFHTPVASGDAYDVTVEKEPSNQTCTVTNGSGTASANVTNVQVSCGAASDTPQQNPPK
jgi:hypothetical protein